MIRGETVAWGKTVDSAFFTLYANKDGKFSSDLNEPSYFVKYTFKHVSYGLQRPTLSSDESVRDHRRRRIILTDQMSEKTAVSSSDYGNAVSLWPMAIMGKNKA